MKQFLLLPILLAAVASVRGASLVEGRIYFRKTKAKEIFQSGEIDSVVCWHAQSPEHIRKFIPAESPGWMWVYLETPHICVCIYSEKGYGIDSNGGIQVGIQKTSSGNASPVMSAMIPNLPNVYGCRAPSAAKPYSCCAITIRRNIDSTYKFKHYETVFTLYCNCVGHVRQHFPG